MSLLGSGLVSILLESAVASTLYRFNGDVLDANTIDINIYANTKV